LVHDLDKDLSNLINQINRSVLATGLIRRGLTVVDLLPQELLGRLEAVLTEEVQQLK